LYFILAPEITQVPQLTRVRIQEGRARRLLDKFQLLMEPTERPEINALKEQPSILQTTLLTSVTEKGQTDQKRLVSSRGRHAGI
jgi:hypothetical protein